MLIALLACCLGFGLFAPAAQARTAAPSGGPKAPTPTARPGLAPQPATGTVAAQAAADEAPAAGKAGSAKQRAPQQAPVQQQLAAKQAAKQATRGLAAAAAASCTAADFGSRSGSALVQQITASSLDCINSLFTLKGSDGHAVFQESQMVAAANALRDASVSYPGDDSTSVGQLVLFLRAGYFVQWYDKDDVGAYGSALQTAIRGGLDAFFANAHSKDVTEANGATLAEAVTLIDSAQENARYLYVVKRQLAGYNSSWNSSYSMLLSLNNVYTVLWRGHQNADFLPAVQADPSVLTALHDFAFTNSALLGTSNDYLASNSGLELGRFLQHPELLSTVQPLVKDVLNRSSIDGASSTLWVNAASQAYYNDQANCSYYGVCTLPADLKAKVLTITYVCSPSITILAQSMNSDQLAASCSSLTGEDAFFHNIVKDKGPVADDYNSAMKLAVFNSSADYKKYAGIIFDMSTDNGGMYMEGNPADKTNQPLFVCYHAEWVPDFSIWNLNHEYTHYLDGRYDMYGNFAAGTSTPTVWWIEGFAEYESYAYRNVRYDDAITQAGLNTYKLSTLFGTTYDNADQTRIYNWGYLAVRYMLQSHRADVDTMLGYFRVGNWAAAQALFNTTIGTRYDADFAAYLAKCNQGDCGTLGQTNQPPTAAIAAVVSGLNVNFTDASKDADGTIASRAWDFGDGTTSTAANPAHSYAKSGSYTVKLTVTDNQGATASATQTVTVAGTPECSDPDTRVLGKNCARSGLSATTGNYKYFYVLLPSGVSTLKINTSGGTGNADLYYSNNGWATTSNYSTASVRTGNTESLTIKNPPAGYTYISLYAKSGFSGVTLTTSF
ncbi:collagenase [Kitasatospora sp. MMS16-BH015]|uniref:collagenase n=1 Tax=Kitasatospora sp. MMS16-BH015 TaxID=2018025 RepID=UPI0020C3240E|nr:collagenase [Kitasatospora sp. MMS16-BH015]